MLRDEEAVLIQHIGLGPNDPIRLWFQSLLPTCGDGSQVFAVTAAASVCETPPPRDLAGVALP